MGSGSVLVLNQNYEPLNVCNVRRAIVLVLRGKAEVIENTVRAIQTATRSITLPSVIRLVTMVRRPRPRVRLTRKEVFARDGWACVYCGRVTRDLTLDHVVLARLAREWIGTAAEAVSQDSTNRGDRGGAGKHLGLLEELLLEHGEVVLDTVRTEAHLVELVAEGDSRIGLLTDTADAALIGFVQRIDAGDDG